MKTRIPTEIVKVLAGHLRESNSPEQEKLFAEWLAVPGNDAEYRKFLKVWNEIVDAETPDFDINNAWSELNRRLAAEHLGIVGDWDEIKVTDLVGYEVTLQEMIEEFYDRMIERVMDYIGAE